MPTGYSKNEINKGQFKKGHIGYKAMLGKKRSEESKEKNRQARLGKKNSVESNEKNRQAHLGKKKSKETKEKMRQSKLGNKNPTKRLDVREKMRQSKLGKNHWNWKGGISNNPYGLEFNENLKEVIRNRDRRKCQICYKTELENKYKLSVHHIDYNKNNNNPNNLISLCVSCHIKTNNKRNYWLNYFNEKIYE